MSKDNKNGLKSWHDSIGNCKKKQNATPAAKSGWQKIEVILAFLAVSKSRAFLPR